eukprot:134875-Chlamydomonas_euryale.AAC.8
MPCAPQVRWMERLSEGAQGGDCAPTEVLETANTDLQPIGCIAGKAVVVRARSAAEVRAPVAGIATSRQRAAAHPPRIRPRMRGRAAYACAFARARVGFHSLVHARITHASDACEASCFSALRPLPPTPRPSPPLSRQGAKVVPPGQRGAWFLCRRSAAAVGRGGEPVAHTGRPVLLMAPAQDANANPSAPGSPAEPGQAAAAVAPAKRPAAGDAGSEVDVASGGGAPRPAAKRAKVRTTAGAVNPRDDHGHMSSGSALYAPLLRCSRRFARWRAAPSRDRDQVGKHPDIRTRIAI